MTFNPDLPVQTRDGRKARIICTDRKTGNPIVALIGEDETIVIKCLANGSYLLEEEDDYDLINIPEKRWAVLFRDKSWAAFDDEEAARQLVRASDRALASLEFTEGEGL